MEEEKTLDQIKAEGLVTDKEIIEKALEMTFKEGHYIPSFLKNSLEEKDPSEKRKTADVARELWEQLGSLPADGDLVSLDSEPVPPLGSSHSTDSSKEPTLEELVMEFTKTEITQKELVRLLADRGFLPEDVKAVVKDLRKRFWIDYNQGSKLIRMVSW